MEAVSRGAAKVSVHVQGAVGDKSSTSRKGGYRRFCNVVRLARNGSGLFAAATAPIDDDFKRGKRRRSYSSVQRHLCSSPLSSNTSGRVTGRVVQPKSEKQVDDDAFASVGFVSSSADAQDEDCSQSFSGRASLFRTGVTALLASLEVQGVMVMHAIAGESNSGGNMQADTVSTAVSAASRAPSWLASAIVAFPLCSYFLFGLYRDKINPSAKVTDWLFTLVAVGIVANIVLQVIWGVRLY